MFPVYYERYIEVFGGGGWVLFHKPPGNDFEVYNDFNSLLVNLYRCVRDKPQELMEALRYVLNSREDFDVVRATLARDSPASDVQKAAWFYELIRYSYAAGLTSFGSQPHDTLTPIVAKLSDMRIVNGDLENMVFEPRKEFIVMQILVLGNIPLLYFLNQEWYDILMHTPMGQIILAVCAAVLFVSTAAVIKLTQPIEYKR